MVLQPFHLAISVDDLAKARQFYGDVLGCPEGRCTDQWVDFDLYGHQLVCHEISDAIRTDVPVNVVNVVDGDAVPIPHFGVVLDWREWEALADRLQTAEISFLVEPTVRFAGQTGEQATLFFADPAGNMLEFKAMRHPDQLFAT